MNKTINIAEILKNVPEGTELFSPLFGVVTFVKITKGDFPITVKTETGEIQYFTAYGRYFDNFHNAECMLFPLNTRDWFTFKIEPHFPMTIFECAEIMNVENEEQKIVGYNVKQLKSLQLLLICRDAWWKVDNNWKPDWSAYSEKYIIVTSDNEINKDGQYIDYINNHILAFSTMEIRNKFLEIFYDLIEECKEFL